MEKIVIGLSGGMDSATLLGYYLQQGAKVHCCSFSYGSKHNQYENEACHNIIEFYRKNGYSDLLKHTHFNLENVFSDFTSNLLLSGGDIPEGHYEDENMKLTVVPGRNTIFVAIMMGFAESIGATKIGLGIHAGDHAIYPDCRKEYLEAINNLVQIATEGKISVVAPLIEMNKTNILDFGYNYFDVDVPYVLTRTCYKNQKNSCGKCGSCQERLEAFQNIGKKDPIQYE